MKDNAIFSTTETLNYIADAIYENLHASEDPLDYGYWVLAFHDTFEDLGLENDKNNKILEFNNFVRISKSKNHRWIFKNICNYVLYFKQEGFIKNADEFISSMIIWVLDPVRSYYTKKEREKAISEINYVLERKGGFINYSNKTKKYFFVKKINIIKHQNNSSKYGGVIESIEILKSDGRLKIYVNKNYSTELDFGRKKFWGMLYGLAENKEVSFNKGFLDYFNSNLKNPLYSKDKFSLTKILKQEDGKITSNIELQLITKKKITQQLKKA